jgi:hypothetical protein
MLAARRFERDSSCRHKMMGRRLPSYNEMFGEFTKSMQCDVYQVSSGKISLTIPVIDPYMIISFY